MVEVDSEHRDAARVQSVRKEAEFYSALYQESITEGDLLRMIPITKSKTAATTRVSTTTIAADPDLVLYSEADARWKVEGLLFVVGESANGDFDYTLNGPTGVGGFFNVAGGTTKVAVGTEVTQATDTTDVCLHVRGIITVGSTAGNIGLWWAQNASHADDQILSAGSFLTFARMLNS